MVGVWDMGELVGVVVGVRVVGLAVGACVVGPPVGSLEGARDGLKLGELVGYCVVGTPLVGVSVEGPLVGTALRG